PELPTLSLHDSLPIWPIARSPKSILVTIFSDALRRFAKFASLRASMPSSSKYFVSGGTLYGIFSLHRDPSNAWLLPTAQKGQYRDRKSTRLNSSHVKI